MPTAYASHLALGIVLAVRTRTWLSCALTAAVLVGCSGDPEPPQSPPPTVTEEPTPEPEPEPLEDVQGTVEEVTIVDTSPKDSGLHQDDSPGDAAIPVDQEALEELVDAVATWLDAHLTDVQAGGPGRLDEAGLEGDTAPVSTHLTGPDHPVTTVAYAITVGVRGTPEWLQVSTTVERADGAMTATFIFLPGGDGVDLLAAHVGDGTPAPTRPPGDPQLEAA